MKNNLITFTIILILLTGCGAKVAERFPKLESRSNFKQSELLPTLESNTTKEKNSIYCSTLLLAWDQVRTELKGNLTVDSGNRDLYLLNKSTSFLESLTKDEYTSSISISGGNIEAKVKFSKSLPFTGDLTDLGYSLMFKKSLVQSFGASGENSIVKILYYKNDTDFVIKLLTKDKSNELIFYRIDSTYNTLYQAVESVNSKILRGLFDRKDPLNYGNYSFNNDDELAIPMLSFNIDTDFPKMSGKSVNCKKKQLLIKDLYQRVAFDLNERGVKIESEAGVKIGAIECYNGQNWKPKHLIFDNSFLVILRKTDKKSPYFAMWVTNDEYMKKDSSDFQDLRKRRRQDVKTDSGPLNELK